MEITKAKTKVLSIFRGMILKEHFQVFSLGMKQRKVGIFGIKLNKAFRLTIIARKIMIFGTLYTLN